MLVANAGITRDQLVLRMSDEDFTAVLDTNLAGAFRGRPPGERRACCALKRGRMVFVSSVVALYG